MTKPATVTDYAAALDPVLREIAEKLQTIVDTVLPQAGAVWHGHPVWSLGPAPGKTPVAYFKAYSSYVLRDVRLVARPGDLRPLRPLGAGRQADGRRQAPHPGRHRPRPVHHVVAPGP